MEKRFVCVDVGGTELKGAPMSESGTLLSPVRHFPANSRREKNFLLEHFARTLRELGCGEADGIRLAFPGPFDYARGVCLMRGQDKYEGLYGVNLREDLSRRLDFPAEEIRFLNDADAFTMGEMGFGGARNAGRSMFICIGTGMGNGFGIDGRMAPPGTPGIPEDGKLYHIPYRNATIDDYISRRGLMALSRERLGEALDGRRLSRRAKEGDPAAIECWAVFGQRVREVLEPWLRSFRPELLCFGGQITRSGALFLPPVEAACRELGVGMYVTEDTSVRALQGLTRI